MIRYITIIIIFVLAIAFYGNLKNWDLEEYFKFIFSILVSLSAGFVGSIFTIQGLDPWYEELTKPWFAPPGDIISIVWIILYILIGISLYIVLTKDLSEKKVKLAILVFGVQLFFNAIWSYLFFGLKSLMFGLIGIIILWITILTTIYAFYRVSKKASYLLTPYILWVTIAMVINISLLLLN